MNPDQIIFFKAGVFPINATIFFTWVIMLLLCLISWTITGKLSSGPKISRFQSILETIYTLISSQIKDVTGSDPTPLVPFLGTLFVFILTANLMEVVPLFHPPTASLSTTAALSICVFFAVPVFGIMKKGVWGFLKEYAQPSVFMILFNILGEITRTVSLSVRLFGNIMSETLIAGILLVLVPLFVPVVMQIFGIIIGTVQAYIFFILATVFVGSAASGKQH
ncbi:F0F1 ATP synthase subunit A [Desulfobacterium sp. N47]